VRKIEVAARLRTPWHAEHVQPDLAQHGPVHGFDEALVVVIPGDHHDLALVLAQGKQRPHHQPLRSRGRRGGLE